MPFTAKVPVLLIIFQAKNKNEHVKIVTPRFGPISSDLIRERPEFLVFKSVYSGCSQRDGDDQEIKRGVLRSGGGGDGSW